ncbi:MAG: DUF4333 domain-containing protein [Phycicoccus sp.]
MPESAGAPDPLGGVSWWAETADRQVAWSTPPAPVASSPAPPSVGSYPTAPLPVVPPPPSGAPGGSPHSADRPPGGAASGTDTLAVLALVFSVIPTVVVGAGLAIASLVRIRRTRERGRSLAIAALVVSCVWAVVLSGALVLAVATVSSSEDAATVQRAAVAQVRKDYPSADVGASRCSGELSWRSGSTVSCTVDVGGESLPMTVRRPETAGDYTVTAEATVVDLRKVESDYTTPVAEAATTDVEIACPEQQTVVRAAGDTFTCDVTAEFGATTQLTLTMRDDGELDWQLASAKALVDGGWVDLGDLERGDCGVKDDSRLDDGMVWAINCARPHDWEVFEARSLPAGSWPGDDAVSEATNEVCIGAFAAYTGEDFNDSALDGGFYWPGQEAWEGGDRSVQCYLYDPQRETGRKLTGSVAKKPAGTT